MAMKIQLDSLADQVILAALREHRSRQAAHLMVRNYAPLVYNFCRTCLPDLELAEDVTQDSFAKAFASFTALQGSATPEVWILDIARQCCAKHADQITSTAIRKNLVLSPSVLQLNEFKQNWRMSESLQRRLKILASSL